MSVLTPLFDENFLLSVWYDEYQAVLVLCLHAAGGVQNNG